MTVFKNIRAWLYHWRTDWQRDRQTTYNA